MERPTRTPTTCLLIWSLVAALLSQNLVFFSSSSSTFQDQKNFFLPPLIFTPPTDPSIGSPPLILTPPTLGSPPLILTPPTDPSVGSPPLILTPPIVHSPPIGNYNNPPPTHGSGGSSPPVHHTPSHGGGHHHHGGKPPTNCGNPTPHHSPPKHNNPSPSHHNNPTPSPSTGYHYSPPPSGGGGGGSTPDVPSTPPVILPPTTPGISFPSPPLDPNSPPIGGTCDFWKNHPGMIWGLFGWWGTTVGSAFGVSTLPGTGTHLNLVEALSNTRTDGIGALYREGTASLLNSMVNKNFPFTTSHVKDSFVAAIGSNKAAAAQARVFKLANEGHMKKIRV